MLYLAPPVQLCFMVPRRAVLFGWAEGGNREQLPAL
jgi:hypothetical protein